MNIFFFKSQSSNTTVHIKELGKKEQSKPIDNRRKETIKIKVGIRKGK